MASEQDVLYHRSFLSYNYVDNFSAQLKALASAGKLVRQYREIAEIKDSDPEAFEEVRKSLATLLKVKYIPAREAGYNGDARNPAFKGQPSDDQVIEYLKPQYPPQGAVKNPTTGFVAIPVFGYVAKAYRDGNTLLETSMLRKADQVFEDYATPWELKYSSVVFQNWNRQYTPIVNTSWTVIGYVCKVTGGVGCDLLVPNYAPLVLTTIPAGVAYLEEIKRRDPDIPDYGSPEDLLRRGIPVFVGPGTSPPPGWASANSGVTDLTYTVRTTTDGEVVAVLSTSSRDGAVPVWYSPADLLSAGKVLVSLAKAGVKLTPTLSRAVTARLGSRSVFKGATKELADEVKLLATKKPPVVARGPVPTPPSQLLSRAAIKSPRLLAKHPGRITDQAMRDELNQKGFELAKNGNHSMQGLQQDSEIWIRKVPNPTGKGEDYFEAVRIDIRYRNPNQNFFKKPGAPPQTPGEVQAADKVFRQRHHTLVDPERITTTDGQAADLMNQGMRKEDLTHWHHERFPANQQNLTEYLTTPPQGSGGPKITGLENFDPTGKVVPNAGERPLPNPGGQR
jgi:hypothetical protein